MHNCTRPRTRAFLLHSSIDNENGTEYGETAQLNYMELI